MQRDGERIEVQGRYVLAVDDGNAYLAAGLAGLGVLWLPDYMARAHVARGELVPLFQDWRLDPMPLYVAFPPNRHVSTKLRVFIEWQLAAADGKHAPVTARATRTRLRKRFLDRAAFVREHEGEQLGRPHLAGVAGDGMPGARRFVP